MPRLSQSHPDPKATLKIFGEVSASDFPSWILRHANKLGLRDVAMEFEQDHLWVRATGAEEMLNALAVACSLGPCSALVDRVDLDVAELDD